MAKLLMVLFRWEMALDVLFEHFILFHFIDL